MNSYKTSVFLFTKLNFLKHYSLDLLENKNNFQVYSYGYSALLTLGMTVLQPMASTVESHSAALKHLILWVLVLALLITCSYSSGLASSMTIPR